MISFDKYRKNKRSIHLKRGEKYFQFASAALCHMFSQRLRYAKFSRKGADALRLRFEKKQRRELSPDSPDSYPSAAKGLPTALRDCEKKGEKKAKEFLLQLFQIYNISLITS